MSREISIRGVSWDFGLVETVEQSQQWVLSAMQSHGESLVTMLWRIFGNEADVCDVYQQTFLNLAHYEGNQKPVNVHAYLFRSATNIAISMLRRKQIRQQSVQVMAQSREMTKNVDYAGELDARVLQEKLRDAISKIPDYLRDVVILRDIAELPYAQIAKILEISAATARVYRYKAITLLATMIDKGNTNR